MTFASRSNRILRSGSLESSSGRIFERDLALQLAVAGAVDLAHPAGTERGDDIVTPESVARREHR